MPPNRRQQTGFTLFELLIVLTVIGVLVGLVLPDTSPAIDEQLRMAADILRNDLALARSLAVSNDSTYAVTFEEDENRYILTHTGTNAALDELPSSPYRALDDSSEELVVDFDELPQMGAAVEYVAAAALNFTLTRVDDVEFDSLGAPTRGGYTVVWLSAGEDESEKYIYLIVYPTTGMVKVGDVTTYAPPAWLLTEEAEAMAAPVAAG